MPKANGTYCTIANLLIVVAIIAIAVGCAPSMRGIRTTTDGCVPDNLIVKPDDHKLSLKWDTNCPEGTILSGYFIYLAEKPIYEKYHGTLPPSSVKLFNPTPYPGLIPGMREEQSRVIVDALRKLRFVVMSEIDQPVHTYYGEELPAVQDFLERHFRIPNDYLGKAPPPWLVVLEKHDDRGEAAFDFVQCRADV